MFFVFFLISPLSIWFEKEVERKENLFFMLSFILNAYNNNAVTKHVTKTQLSIVIKKNKTIEIHSLYTIHTFSNKRYISYYNQVLLKRRRHDHMIHFQVLIWFWKQIKYEIHKTNYDEKVRLKASTEQSTSNTLSSKRYTYYDNIPRITSPLSLV